MDNTIGQDTYWCMKNDIQINSIQSRKRDLFQTENILFLARDKKENIDFFLRNGQRPVKKKKWNERDIPIYLPVK